MTRTIARHGVHPRRLGATTYTLVTVAMAATLALAVLAGATISPWWLLAGLAAGAGFAIWPGWDVEMTCPEPDCARCVPAWRKGR